MKELIKTKINRFLNERKDFDHVSFYLGICFVLANLKSVMNSNPSKKEMISVIKELENYAEEKISESAGE